MIKTSLSNRFTDALAALKGNQKPDPQNGALIKQRDDLLAMVADAETAYNALADAKAGADAELETVKAQRDAAVKDIADFKAAAAEKEAALRAEIAASLRTEITADVKNKELATLAGSQGVPADQIAPQAKSSGIADTVASLTAQLQAEKDPRRKGELILKIKEARKNAA